MKELVLDAIRDFDTFFSLLEGKEKSKVGTSFRSRCREVPSLIEDVGLGPALSFCYAKAEDRTYKEVKNLMTSRQSVIKEDEATKKGYAIYLYLVLNRLKELGLIEANLNEPRNALEELMKSGMSVLASKLIRPYLVQLKRLSEAVFEKAE